MLVGDANGSGAVAAPTDYEWIWNDSGGCVVDHLTLQLQIWESGG